MDFSNIKNSWLSLLNEHIKQIIKKLNFIENELITHNINMEILPKKENIFRCFNYFELNELNC